MCYAVCCIEAAPGLDETRLTKQWWTEQVQTAVKGGVKTAPLPVTGRIVFAGTCLGRWKQATLALLLNCVLCWKFKGRVVVLLMTVGEDYDEITTLLRVIAPAVKYGMVQLC